MAEPIVLIYSFMYEVCWGRQGRGRGCSRRRRMPAAKVTGQCPAHPGPALLIIYLTLPSPLSLHLPHFHLKSRPDAPPFLALLFTV